MTLALTWAALRRRPLSLMVTAFMTTAFSGLLGAPVPLAFVAWICVSTLSLELGHAIEPFILRRLGARTPTHSERKRLEAALGCGRLDLLITDTHRLGLGRGARCLVISRATMDVLEDRALAGLAHQAVARIHCEALAGELLVWTGNLPILIAWWISRGLTRLGHLLGIAVGASLVVPLVLWPHGFVRWSGGLFGALIVGLLGTALVSGGQVAAGAGLLLAWALVPAIRALLAWETRRAEASADRATIGAGLGWQLLEAVELLALAEPLPTPDAAVRLVARAGVPLTDRAQRIRRALSA